MWQVGTKDFSPTNINNNKDIVLVGFSISGTRAASTTGPRASWEFVCDLPMVQQDLLRRQTEAVLSQRNFKIP
jgi:hypothetical protein